MEFSKITANQFYMGLRRWFYCYFRKEYVRQSLARRKGKCRQCSCCGQVKVFSLIICPFFNKKENKCRLYNTKFMPRTCRFFPFDRKDRDSGNLERIAKNCGYYWPDKQ